MWIGLPEFFEIVLHWRTRQNDSMIAGQSLAHDADVGVGVTNAVTLVKDHVLPLHPHVVQGLPLHTAIGRHHHSTQRLGAFKQLILGAHLHASGTRKDWDNLQCQLILNPQTNPKPNPKPTTNKKPTPNAWPDLGRDGAAGGVAHEDAEGWVPGMQLARPLRQQGGGTHHEHAAAQEAAAGAEVARKVPRW